MKVKVKLVFKQSADTVVVVGGIGRINQDLMFRRDMSGRTLEVLEREDIVKKVIETEQFIEQLTGLRLHIEFEDPGPETEEE